MTKAQTIDRERLERLAGLIQAEASGAYPEDLLHRLGTEEGLKFAVKKGRLSARMAGVGASMSTTAAKIADVPTSARIGAVKLWANAARRAVK